MRILSIISEHHVSISVALSRIGVLSTLTGDVYRLALDQLLLAPPLSKPRDLASLLSYSASLSVPLATRLLAAPSLSRMDGLCLLPPASDEPWKEQCVI